MLHGVDQHFLAEDVHIQVMCAPGEIAVQDVDQILGALPVTVAQGTGVDGLGVGNAVQGVLVGQLGDGIQGGNQAGLLRAVAGVGAGGQRGPGPAAVGHIAGILAVDHVGGNGQDGGGGLGIPVGVVVPDLLQEGPQQPHGDGICPVIVVAVAGEVALHLEVRGVAVLIPDDLDLGILDGAQGVHHMAEACNAGGEGTAHVGIDQGHLAGFVVILVVHIVDQVQGVYIEPCQPLHSQIELLLDLVVVQVFGLNAAGVGGHLLLMLQVPAAIDGVQQGLGQVGTGAEELHFLAGLGCGDTAADGVVIAPDRTHNLVILILNGRGGHGDVGAVFLEVLRQPGSVQHGHIGLRGGAHVLQSVQEAVVGLGDHVPAVLTDAAHLQCCPHRVTGEQLLVGGNPGKFDHAALHNKVVDELLSSGLGENALFQVSLNIDIQEGGHPAHGHGRAVLGLDGGEVAEVQPLDRLMGVGGGARDIIAVAFRHLLHILQGTDLLGDLLPQADHIVGHGAVAGVLMIPLLLLDQVVHAVEGHPAIVAHNAATAIGIGQAGDDVGVAGLLHLGGIGIKNRLVVGLVVVGEDLVQLGTGRVAIGGAGLLRHLNAAIGHEGTLQGLVGL